MASLEPIPANDNPELRQAPQRCCLDTHQRFRTAQRRVQAILLGLRWESGDSAEWATGTAVNDNPLWHWRGTCSVCGADMGPVRDASLCHPCNAVWLAGLKGSNGEVVNTTDIPDDLRCIGIVGLYKHEPCKLVVSNPEGIEHR